MFFQNSVIKKYLAVLNTEQVTAAWEVYFTQYKSALNDISAQIADTDRDIDTLVYALYGLSEDEIKLIEN